MVSKKGLRISTEKHKAVSGGGGIQSVFKMLVDFHDCSLIPTTVTIVGSTKNCNHILVMCPAVSLGEFNIMRMNNDLENYVKQVIRH